MARPENLWIPLVDEPIGSIVAQIQEEDPEIDELVSSPHRLLAFRTFAYIRVGLLLGELLMDEDLEPYDGSETWVEQLLADPDTRGAVAREVRDVADEIAADPAYAAGEDLGPDEETRGGLPPVAERPPARDRGGAGLRSGRGSRPGRGDAAPLPRVREAPPRGLVATPRPQSGRRRRSRGTLRLSPPSGAATDGGAPPGAGQSRRCR